MSRDDLGKIQFNGEETGFQNVANIIAQALENFTGAGRGTKLVFEVTPISSTTKVEIMTAHPSGVLIGSSGTPDSSAGLEVRSTFQGVLFPRMTTVQKLQWVRS